MTNYKIKLSCGPTIYINTEILEQETTRCHPQGLLSWLTHELSMEWEYIEKHS